MDDTDGILKNEKKLLFWLRTAVTALSSLILWVAVITFNVADWKSKVELNISKMQEDISNLRAQEAEHTRKLENIRVLETNIASLQREMGNLRDDLKTTGTKLDRLLERL